MATITRQQIAGLSTLVREVDTGNADSAVVLLHGWGADGADLMDLAPMLGETLPNTVFVAPDGPSACSANPMGRQWFDLSGTEIDAGPDEAQPALQELVGHLNSAHGIDPSKVVIAGFSQGGMMALHLGLRQTPALAGVISFSGALLAPEKVEAETQSRPPVLLVHGRDDQVVPFQAMAIAEAMLKTNDVEVTSVPRDGLGHGIDGEGMSAALAFIQRVLAE